MEREQQRTFVAFGGNLGDPIATFQKATDALIAIFGTVQSKSSLYETTPLTLNGETQPIYLNGVLEFSSDRSPHEVLGILLEIERQCGRDRSGAVRWAPRTIDLDLIFMGSLKIESTELTLPHPECHKRDFVLAPLSEIAPTFQHPTFELTVRELNDSLEERGFERYVVRRVPIQK